MSFSIRLLSLNIFNKRKYYQHNPNLIKESFSKALEFISDYFDDNYITKLFDYYNSISRSNADLNDLNSLLGAYEKSVIKSNSDNLNEKEEVQDLIRKTRDLPNWIWIFGSLDGISFGPVWATQKYSRSMGIEFETQNIFTFFIQHFWVSSNPKILYGITLSSSSLYPWLLFLVRKPNNVSFSKAISIAIENANSFREFDKKFKLNDISLVKKKKDNDQKNTKIIQNENKDEKKNLDHKDEVENERISNNETVGLTFSRTNPDSGLSLGSSRQNNLAGGLSALKNNYGNVGNLLQLSEKFSGDGISRTEAAVTVAGSILENTIKSYWFLQHDCSSEWALLAPITLKFNLVYLLKNIKTESYNLLSRSAKRRWGFEISIDIFNLLWGLIIHRHFYLNIALKFKSFASLKPNDKIDGFIKKIITSVFSF